MTVWATAMGKGQSTDHGKLAARYRENAEEVRVRAETLGDENARELLLKLAADYDGTAAHYAALATGQKSKR